MKTKLDKVQARIALNSMYGLTPKIHLTPRGYGGTHITGVIVEQAKMSLAKAFVKKMDDDIFRTSISFLISHEYENSYNFFKIIYPKMVSTKSWSIIDELYRRQFDDKNAVRPSK